MWNMEQQHPLVQVTFKIKKHSWQWDIASREALSKGLVFAKANIYHLELACKYKINIDIHIAYIKNTLFYIHFDVQ